MIGARWTVSEDDELVRLRVKCRRTWVYIAEKLNRGPMACEDRYAVITFAPDVPFAVQKDAEYVAQCLALGGFPRALAFEGKSLLVGPEGKLWRAAA